MSHMIQFRVKLIGSFSQFLQETSFASNQPVTRSLSSVSGSGPVKKSLISRLPVPTSSVNNKAHHQSVNSSVASTNNGTSSPSVSATTNGKSSSLRNSFNNRLNSSFTSAIPDSTDSSLEQISPWLVSDHVIATKKEKSKIPQLRTVITTELWCL